MRFLHSKLLSSLHFWVALTHADATDVSEQKMSVCNPENASEFSRRAFQPFGVQNTGWKNNSQRKSSSLRNQEINELYKHYLDFKKE